MPDTTRGLRVNCPDVGVGKRVSHAFCNAVTPCKVNTIDVHLFCALRFHACDSIRVGWLNGGVLREQKMLKGHLPRGMYHRLFLRYEDKVVTQPQEI